MLLFVPVASGVSAAAPPRMRTGARSVINFRHFCEYSAGTLFHGRIVYQNLNRVSIDFTDMQLFLCVKMEKGFSLIFVKLKDGESTILGLR